MSASNKDVLHVLDAVVRYLSIDLPCQPLTPDAQMGREDLLQKVEHLMGNLGVPNPVVPEELYDDLVTKDVLKEIPITDPSKRMSSYMDMTQFQPCSTGVGEEEDIQDETDTMAETVAAEETYEEPELGHHSDSSGGSAEGSNEGVNDVTEFTDNELLQKLKELQNTCPKITLKGALCSGYMMKQKKKVISKFNKRFCIVNDCFMFYYKSENDIKALGVIVLPGYQITIDESSIKSNKFIFKLIPYSKGRSTYLFQLNSKIDFDMWQNVLAPICSQKLNRLKSDLFNRVAKQLDEKAESDEGSAGEPIKPCLIPEDGDLYEPIPEDGLHSTIGYVNSPIVCESLYDDHVEITLPVAIVQEDIYEGIDGEVFMPDTLCSEPEPIQEDIYEDIPGAQAIPDRPSNIGLPSLPVFAPSTPAPVLPARTPVLPPRSLPSLSRPGNEEAPLPPSIPSRKAVADEPIEPIEEESDDEDAAGPAENDFSYDNVYLGTVQCQANEADELSFNRGDIIYILNKVDPHWWIGCLDKKVGLVQSDLLVAGFAH